MEIKRIAFIYKKRLLLYIKKDCFYKLIRIAFTYKKNCFPAKGEKAIFYFHKSGSFRTGSEMRYLTASIRTTTTVTNVETTATSTLRFNIQHN